VGKGIALGLGEAGATVYITGRTVEEGKGAVALPGTIYQTAQEVEQLGGQCIALQCDHTQDEQTAKVFERIGNEQKRLDILVNNVWGGYEKFSDGLKAWTEPGRWAFPLSRWDKMFQAGVRAHFLCSLLAAPLMTAQKAGLIVNISFISGQQPHSNVAYGSAKAASDHMARCLALKLRKYKVAVVALYPGLVRTESVLKASKHFDLSNSESPQFVGRAVAALAADPKIMQKTGQVLVAAKIALEYGFTDIDGKQPQPLI
jgi:NAD(P)-dependent dehydrogenase (short-subunit alcohol dehydrogenase family)